MKVLTMRLYNRVDQHRVFGLVGFELTLDDAGAAATALHFRAGSQHGSFPVEELRDMRPGTNRSPATLVFHLNTFLLENGPLTVEIFVDDKPGQSTRTRIAAYEVLVDNKGTVANSTAKALAALNKPAFLPAMVDSEYFGPHEDPQLQPWFEKQPSPMERAFAWIARRFRRASDLPSAARTTNEAMQDLKNLGYCVLPQRIPDELCDELVRQAREYVDNEGKRQGYQWGSSQRLLNTHNLAAGKQVWMFPPVLDFLRQWFRDEPAPCQTLFYFFGSEQQAHQDTIHLTPFPAGYMCGVWVALEDVVPGSGELFVYPRSHKLTRLRSRGLGLGKVAADYSPFKVFDQAVAKMMRDHDLPRIPYHAKKGTVLVWHENLTHGGEKRIHLQSSRASIVSHYFARGAVAYYDARGEAAALTEIPGKPTATAA